MFQDICVSLHQISTPVIIQEDIVRTIEAYYNVRYKDILAKFNQNYPDNIAKDMVIYMYRNVLHMKIVTIAKEFSMTARNISYRLQHSTPKIKGKGKLAKDYKDLMEILNG